MKNKFMTKALAVVLSASMALSLSSATALTANGAAAPKLAKKAVTVKVGKKAKNKLAKASFKAGWRISKATVKKTKVAKATVKKNKKVVVLTGVQKGKSKVVVALKNAKTGAAKKVKFTVKVKVDEVKPEPEPVAEVPSFVDAKQTKNNEVVLTLDKELEAVPTADVLRIYESDKDYAPTAINFGADKKTLVVNFDFAASDSAKSFTYTFKTTDGSIKGEKSITTKSYDVAKIVADNQTVPAGKLSVLKFTLESAAGIDVTTAGDNLSYTTVSFEGDEARAITSSTAPQVLLSEVGDKTKMTITYTKDTTVEPVSVEITAVEAEATAAKAMKFSCPDRQAWLFSSELTEADVFVDETGSFKFWAKTDDPASALGYSAVKYDEIEVTSSKEEILSVSDSRNSKYDEISYTGLKTGRADIVIKCVEHVGSKDIPTTYTIPVEVKAKNNDLATFEVSKGSVSITNAIDRDYSESVDVYALNSNGTSVDATYSVEVTDSKGNATKEISVTTPASSQWASGKNKTTMTITAPKAAKGTYSVKITCEGTKAGGTDTETKSRTISVRVDDVLSVVTGDSATPTKEITSDAALFLKDSDRAEATNVSMIVKINGKFVGYVRNEDYASDTTDPYFAPTYAVGDYDMAYSDAVATKVRYTLAVKAEITDLTFYVQDKSQAFVHESDNTAPDANHVTKATVYLGGDKVKAADFLTASGNQVKVAANNKNLFTLSIYDKGVAPADVYFFGATSSKNEGIAAAGSYTVVAYNGMLFNGAATKDTALGVTLTQIGNKKSVNVSYAITAPEITYSPSESADMFANPSTWLVLEDNADTLGFAWKASKDDKDLYANKHAKAKSDVGATFTTKRWLRSSSNSFSSGNKVFATSVPVTLNKGGSTIVINYVSENEKSIGA